MPEESPLVRQWILLRVLCTRRYGATVKEMVDEMGVSDKTIRRDLETFQKAGFPLEETVGDHGLKRWRVDPAKTQPGLTFTFDEAIALYLGRHLMEPLAGTLFWEASQRAFKKIRATLGANAEARSPRRPTRGRLGAAVHEPGRGPETARSRSHRAKYPQRECFNGATSAGSWKKRLSGVDGER